ncbi:MAG: Na+/H+ antiporter NhaC family protein [Tissierellales bacterium]|jgi:Na+/H+ antiporter NhaC|nr:Na+/H+ antiporter NhaC family protein [Tissierellales bacterium]
MESNSSKASALGLLPLFVFLLLFIGSGIITGDFYAMPVLVAFVIASTVALCMNRSVNLEKKIEVFCKGASDSNIILMCLIFLLAGAFGSISSAMGGVESTVNFGLSILPQNLLLSGIFVICCFISLSMGTSMGTMVALAPIGIGVAEQTGIPVALALASVVGGSMFGDNLSMISDTTIAATKTQGCEMKDKFKVNFLIVLPAAVITAILLSVLAGGMQTSVVESHDFSFIKILPYIAVLVSALLGMNVLAVLMGGIVLSGAIGLFDGSFEFLEMLQTGAKGMQGMEDLAMISLIIGGLVELIKLNGGIDFLINFIHKTVSGRRGGEFGIAILTSLINMCTANNTISIVMAGPLAKNISEEYDIDPKRSASILDLFASSIQGIIPYGAQLLFVSGLSGVSSFAIVKYMYYPFLTLIAGVIAITFNIPNLKFKKSVSKKVA